MTASVGPDADLAATAARRFRERRARPSSASRTTRINPRSRKPASWTAITSES